VNAALFSAALSPFVSEALFANYGLPFPVAVGLALAGGCFMGFIAAVIIPHMVPLHKGFNQFNAGLSNGFVAFVVNGFIFNGLKVSRLETGILGKGYNAFCIIALFIMFVLCTLSGWFLDGHKAVQDCKDLFFSHGHKRDYVYDHGVPAVLLNMGIHGAFVTLYYIAAGAAFTGPTFGCVLCMLSLTASCASPRTVYPIMIGYILFSLLPASSPINAQGVLVGFCFATSLAPIVGIYGLMSGIIAGILHCAVVGNVSIIHGGFNLYNGGFTSGLVCLVLVPILENFFKTKDERRSLRELALKELRELELKN
jgi:MFS family permease